MLGSDTREVAVTVQSGMKVLLVFSLAGLAGAQNNGANTRGVTGTLSATADANQNESQSTRDKWFLRDATESGLAAVQVSQLAVQKASSDDVKQFAQKVVDDRTMLTETMNPIAELIGLKAPKKLGRKDQAEFNRLAGLSGEAFDLQFVTYMVKMQRASLESFHDEAKKATDMGLKHFVEHGLPLIEEDTALAERMAVSRGLK